MDGYNLGSKEYQEEITAAYQEYVNGHYQDWQGYCKKAEAIREKYNMQFPADSR